MTIQLTKATYVSGVLAASGSQHTLDEQTESYLVHIGAATWVETAYTQGRFEDAKIEYDSDGVAVGVVGRANEVVGPVWQTDASGNVVGLVGPGGAVDISPAWLATNRYAASFMLKNHATSTYKALGYDSIDGVLFIRDDTGGVLRIAQTSDNWTTNPAASSSKGLPADVSYANVAAILRFNGKIVLLARATSDSIVKVWTADPVLGNTAYTWAGPYGASGDSTTTALWTSISADATYIYRAEYGDPTGGPRLWRSTDAVTWTAVYGPDATLRHIHHVAPDPYNPGHVYMTCGDGTAKTVQRSTDYGATWSVIVASSAWQAVQISFTPSYVWFAGDSKNGIVWVMDRNELTPKWACPQLLRNIPVTRPTTPATDAYYYNAWYGVADPVSETYYCSANDSSAGGTIPAPFMVPSFGMPPVTMTTNDTGGLFAGTIQAPVFIAGGMVWMGIYRARCANT